MKICQNPECKLEAKVKYCSRSCAAKVNNCYYKKRGVDRNTAKHTPCLQCGKSKPPHRNFCSKNCYNKNVSDKSRKEFYDWKASGAQAPHSKHGLRQVFRRLMVEEALGKCPKCGWGEVNKYLGYAVLTVNHIDGDNKNNCYDNLEVLCWNCHTLTPRFGGLDARPEGARGVTPNI